MTEHDFRVEDTARGSRSKRKKNRKKKKNKKEKKRSSFPRFIAFLFPPRSRISFGTFLVTVDHLFPPPSRSRYRTILSYRERKAQSSRRFSHRSTDSPARVRSQNDRDPTVNPILIDSPRALSDSTVILSWPRNKIRRMSPAIVICVYHARSAFHTPGCRASSYLFSPSCPAAPLFQPPPSGALLHFDFFLRWMKRRRGQLTAQMRTRR